MLFNVEIFGILMGISVGTWALVNRAFTKDGVKLIVSEIHSRFLADYVRADGSKRFSLAKVTRWAVSIWVLIVAAFLVAIAHVVNLQIIIEQTTELNYAGGLLDATFVKCFFGIETTKYSWQWWADVVLTMTLIYSLSKFGHRFEQYFGFKYGAAKKAAQ